jgi:nucleoside-diphosphate-sugar epimerase
VAERRKPQRSPRPSARRAAAAVAEPRPILVTGAAGGHGQVATRHLASLGVPVVGMDVRKWWGKPPSIEFHEVSLLKRDGEDVFRTLRPRAVLHLGTTRSPHLDPELRYRINLDGARRVFDACLKYGVEQLVFVNRTSVYGALADHPTFITEETPPSAGRTFPEMQDLIAADLYATGMLWRHPELSTAVLRVVNVIGLTVSDTLSRYLRRATVPTVMGYDPMMQVLHEQDAARAYVLAIEKKLRGVFNVAGPDPVPLSVLIAHAGARRLPVPEPLLRAMLGRFGFPQLPQGSVDFLKFSCLVDDSAFRKATGFVPELNAQATLGVLRDARLFDG